MSPKTFTLTGIVVSLFAALFATPALAHHSGAMYDAEQTIEVAATVTGFEWTNPHAWLQIRVNDDESEMAEWDLELGSPVQLVRQGWRPRTVAPGDDVTIHFHPHKDGVPTGVLVTVTLPNGETLTSD